MASLLQKLFSGWGKNNGGSDLMVMPTVIPSSNRVGNVLALAAADKRRGEQRDVAQAAVLLPENREDAAKHALGLVSESYNACNIQEVRLALYVLRILDEVANEKREGRCPHDKDDIAILLGEESPYEEGTDNALYLAGAIRLWKEALFHVYVAAFQRQNTMYLPFHEEDREALIFRELIEKHGEGVIRALVAEDASRHLGGNLPESLPKLTINFVGILQNPVEIVTPPE